MHRLQFLYFLQPSFIFQFDIFRSCTFSPPLTTRSSCRRMSLSDGSHLISFASLSTGLLRLVSTKTSTAVYLFHCSVSSDNTGFALAVNDDAYLGDQFNVRQPTSHRVENVSILDTDCPLLPVSKNSSTTVRLHVKPETRL